MSPSWMAAESNLNLFPFLLFLAPLLFLVLKHLTQFLSSTTGRLPPGPQSWPLLGNLPHIGKKPHLDVAKMAHSHGPLISLRLGTQLVVFGSSADTACEILKTHDRILSARHVPKMSPLQGPDLDHRSLAWQSECGDRWKFNRTICRTGLFSPKAIEEQAPVREKKVIEMLQFLAAKEGEVVNLAEVVFAAVFNILSNLLLSKDFIDLEDKGRTAGGLKGVVWRMMELGATPNISDFYPVLASLDLQRLKKETWKCCERMFAVWDVLLKERRQGGGDTSRPHDFLDLLLHNDFSDDQINTIILV